MTMISAADKPRFRRLKAEQAIQFAVQNRWNDALGANRAILEIYPADIDAQNRSGKALMELGQYAAARAAYKQALQADPNNAIARRNLGRIENLKDVPATERIAGEKIDLALFIEETGKTGYSSLYSAADPRSLARVTAGDKLELRPQGGQLAVHAADGAYLGLIEPRVGLRIASMIESGNQYIAAVQSVTEGNMRVVIRETLQDPSQAGKLSFSTKPDDFRGYTKDSLVHRWEPDDDDEDEDDDAEADLSPDWDERRTVTTKDDDDDDGDGRDDDS